MAGSTENAIAYVVPPNAGSTVSNTTGMANQACSCCEVRCDVCFSIFFPILKMKHFFIHYFFLHPPAIVTTSAFRHLGSRESAAKVLSHESKVMCLPDPKQFEYFLEISMD